MGDGGSYGFTGNITSDHKCRFISGSRSTKAMGSKPIGRTDSSYRGSSAVFLGYCLECTMWGPRSIAKLVEISPITMVYGRYNYSYWGGSKPTYNWGAPHCRKHELPNLTNSYESIVRKLGLPLCNTMYLFWTSPSFEAFSRCLIILSLQSSQQFPPWPDHHSSHPYLQVILSH